MRDFCIDGLEIPPFVAAAPGTLGSSIEMWRARVPDGGDIILPMLSVVTVSDDEISDRVALGEFSFDVIEEHASWIWFRDRESFRAAYRVARMIARGGCFSYSLVPGVLYDVREIGGRPCALIMKASAHHIQQEAE